MSKKTSGFASMEKERLREVAKKGAAGNLARRHVFTAEERLRGSKKGGVTASKDREHMSRIGKLGGARVKACDGDHPMPECLDPQCWRRPSPGSDPDEGGFL